MRKINCKMNLSWTFISFFLLNIALLVITSFLENSIFHRSLIGTFTIYCSYLSVLKMYFSNYRYSFFFSSLIILFIVSIFLCVVFFLLIEILPNPIFQDVALFLIYICLSALVLSKHFKVDINIISIIKLVVLTIISWVIMNSISNITRFDYGYSIMCSLWSLSFTIIIFEKRQL